MPSPKRLTAKERVLWSLPPLALGITVIIIAVSSGHVGDLIAIVVISLGLVSILTLFASVYLGILHPTGSQKGADLANRQTQSGPVQSGNPQTRMPEAVDVQSLAKLAAATVAPSPPAVAGLEAPRILAAGHKALMKVLVTGGERAVYRDSQVLVLTPSDDGYWQATG